MKKFVLVLILVSLLVVCCSCEYNFETNQTFSGNRVTGGNDVQRFDYAYVMMGDKVIAEGKVEQWRDYQNSDTIQVVIDGRYYLTHYTNVVMVASVYNRLGSDWDYSK